MSETCRCGRPLDGMGYDECADCEAGFICCELCGSFGELADEGRDAGMDVCESCAPMAFGDAEGVVFTGGPA